MKSKHLTILIALVFVAVLFSCNKSEKDQAKASEIEQKEMELQQRELAIQEREKELVADSLKLVQQKTKAAKSGKLPIPKGYRLPTKADVEADEQNNGEISSWNAFKEMFPTPYLAEGDFNGDGRKDKAYILIKDNYHDWGLFCFFNTESGYVAKRVPFDSSYKGYNVKNMLVFKWNKEVCSNEKGELKSPKKFKYDVIGLGVFDTCDEIACFYNVNNDKFEKYFGCFD